MTLSLCRCAALWGALLFAGAACAQITISPATLPDGTVGVHYSQALTASGCPLATCVWSVSGNLPPGVQFSVLGTLSGNPTTAGSFPFTVTGTDGLSSGQRMYTVVINPPSSPLTITTPSPLPSGTVNVQYSQLITASGGTPPYTWTPSALPTWLTASPGASGETVSGNPTTAGPYSFTLTVTDSATPAASANQTYALTINPPPPPTITTASLLPNSTVGTLYSQQLNASGGTPPYSWSVSAGSPPTGVSLSLGGLLSGIPSAAGNSSFTVQVTDSANVSVTQQFTLTITSNSSNLTITTNSLPGGTVGVAYSQTLNASGGTKPYTWSVSAGTPPAGIVLNSSGLLTGTPSVTAAGATFTVLVTDSVGASATQPFTLTITSNSSNLTITTNSLPGGTVGAAYSQQLSASGGTLPYTWSVSAGAPATGHCLELQWVACRDSLGHRGRRHLHSADHR